MSPPTNQDRGRLLDAADVDPLIADLRFVEAAIADEQRRFSQLMDARNQFIAAIHERADSLRRLIRRIQTKAGTNDPARPV